MTSTPPFGGPAQGPPLRPALRPRRGAPLPRGRSPGLTRAAGGRATALAEAVRPRRHAPMLPPPPARPSSLPAPPLQVVREWNVRRRACARAATAATPVAPRDARGAEHSQRKDCVDWSRRDWSSAYVDTAEEPEGYWLQVTGRLPADLHGTLYRNGPGVFSLGNQQVSHPFDGHGLLASISFVAGRAFFRSRFVETEGYRNETQSQRPLYRSTFGTQLPGGWLQNALDLMPKNVANTAVLPWAGRCLALFEAGQPHAVDPATLETLGLDDVGGRLRLGAPFSSGHSLVDVALATGLSWLRAARGLPGGVALGGDALAAHAHMHGKGGSLTLFSYSLRIGRAGLETEITFYEFGMDFRLVASTRRTVPGYALLHDIAITANHIVAFQNPVDLDAGRFIAGQAAPIHCLKWAGERRPLRVLVLPRPRQHSEEASAATHAPQPKGGGASNIMHANGAQGTLGVKEGGLRRTEILQCQPTGKQSHARRKRGGCLQPGARAVGFLRQVLDRRRDMPGVQAFTSTAHEQHNTSPIGPNCACPDAQLASLAQRTTAEASTTGCWQHCAAAADRSLEAHAAFVFHHANAYEADGGARLIVDCVRYPRMPDFEQACGSGRSFVRSVQPVLQPISELWRFTLDLRCDTVAEERRLSPYALEFPAVNPVFAGRRHQYVFAASASLPGVNLPQQSLLRVNVESGAATMWSPGPRWYLGEPTVVPRRPPSGEPEAAAEDAAWVLVLCYDAARRTSLCAVLDAANVAAGPVARLHLRAPLPHGLHCAWSDECHAPPG